MKKTVFAWLFSLFVTPIWGQEKSVFLPDVSISAPFCPKEELDSILTLPTKGNFADGLCLSPAVFIKNYGPGASASLSIRGTAAAHSTIVWKGIPIGSPMLSMVDLSLLPGLLLEDARIQTGGPAIVGFSGNFGGSIKLKTGNDTQKNRLRIGSSVGSFGQFQNWLSVEQIIKNGSISVRAWHQLAENNFSYRFENEQKTQFHSSKKDQGIISELDLFLPGNWHWKPALWLQQNNREIGPSVSEIHADALQKDKSLRIVNSFSKSTTNSEIEFSHAYAFQRLNYESKLMGIDSRNAVHENFFQARFNQKFGRFQVGLQAFQTISKAVSTNFTGNPEQWKSEILGKTTIEVIPEKFQVRAQLHSVFFTHSEISNSGYFLLPSIQLECRQASSGTFSMGIFRKARVPGLNDLFWQNAGNSSLKCENGWSADFNWDKEIRISNGLAISNKSSAFISKIEDFIQWVPVSGIWMPHNLATVEIQGFSLSPTLAWNQSALTVQTISQIQFTQSLQTRSRFKGDLSVGNQLMYIPKWNSVLGLKTRFGKWEALFWVEKTGIRYTDPANESALPSYSIWNARVGFESKIKSKLMVKTFVEGLNLTGRSYQSVKGFPMPLHQFQFSIILSYQ